MRKLLEADIDELTTLTEQILWRYLPNPPETLVDLQFVKSSETMARLITLDNALVKKGIKNYERIIANFETLNEYETYLLENKSTPVFNPNMTYMTIIDSIELIDKLLKFQFPDINNRKEFVKNCFGWLEKAERRRLFMWFLGPPKAGKTLLAQALCEYRGPVATLRDLRKGNNFPFETLPGNFS